MSVLEMNQLKQCFLRGCIAMNILLFMKKDNENSKVYMKEFYKSSLKLALTRLKILNTVMVMLCVYLFVNDYLMMKSISNSSYRSTLFVAHMGFLIISLVYLVLIKSTDQYDSDRWIKIKWSFVYAYICLAIMLGIAVGLNSIKLNLNIYTYITIIMFLNAFIPSNPFVTAIIISFYHALFLFSISSFVVDKTTIIVNQINGTVSVVVSMVILFVFYNLRKNEFINEKKLIERERNMAKLFEINPLPLLLINLKSNKIIMANKKSIEHFHIITEKTDLALPRDGFVNVEDKLNIINRVKKYGNINDYILEIENDGIKEWIMCNGELVNYNEEEHILVGIIDITKTKLHENDLAKKASIDALTGMFNRLKGMELLDKLYNSLDRSNEMFSIVFCDINSLKGVNDMYGHKEGDDLIYIIAQTITKVLEDRDFVFRYGGDEFIIIMFNKDESECSCKIKAIQAFLDEYRISYLKPYDISMSYGITVVNVGTEIPLQELVGLADKRMYSNKEEYYKTINKL